MQPAQVQWTADDYAGVIADHLPTGTTWPRDADSSLMAWVSGCAQIWGDVSARAVALLVVEADPRLTTAMLPEWERAFGLPDPCVKRTLTIPERRQALVNKLTTQGGQSRQFFINTAAALGYTITIREFRPFQFGLSSFGGKRGAFFGPTSRFYWRVTVTGPRLTRFQFGTSSFGRDSFLEIVKAVDLQCVFTRWGPAHCTVIFDYLGA